MQQRVLFASHDAPSRDPVASGLAAWGYEVTVAQDGVEAWSALQKADAPRIVILDEATLGPASHDLSRRIRDLRDDDSFVVILTEGESKASRIEALEAGADEVMAKPVHLRELRIRLATCLRGRRHIARSSPPASTTPLSTKDPSDMALVGRIVARKYQIERLIGKGGMGTVWQGKHLALGMKVAIKFIKAEYAQHSLARARFELEARATAQLHTKYAVHVFDYGITEGGLPYLVMEYLEGPALLPRVQSEGPLSFADTVRLVTQVAHALGQLHSRGMIHRDVKPDNILLVKDPDATSGSQPGLAKLIDFGVAKVLVDSLDAPPESGAAIATQMGMVVGTPNFMPPEQLRGDAEPDTATDLWALAACAFTAITGRIPFEGSMLTEVVRRVCREPLPVPSRVNPSVPAAFDAWFARACHRDPEQRFLSARELAAELTRCFEGHGVTPLRLSKSLTTFVATGAQVDAGSYDRLFELDEPALAG